MKTIRIPFAVFGVLVGFVLVGCGQQQASETEQTSSTTRESAQTVAEPIQEQTSSWSAKTEQPAVTEAAAENDALISQAQEFLSSGQYEEAMNAAQQVLAQDSNSPEAQDIVLKAHQGMMTATEQQAEQLEQTGQDAAEQVGEQMDAVGQEANDALDNVQQSWPAAGTQQ